MVARRHILALLVALLWLVGCTSTPLLGSADERVMQAADVDALPARRTENRQIPCPSTGKDTKANPPHVPGIPSASGQAIEQSVGPIHSRHAT
ncbi:MAG TPA: hypothetical protein VK034_22260, partial [Enhygromyxa sp.]|nr:hypothetical protein [Enhygromyxa sp.]